MKIHIIKVCDRIDTKTKKSVGKLCIFPMLLKTNLKSGDLEEDVEGLKACLKIRVP